MGDETALKIGFTYPASGGPVGSPLLAHYVHLNARRRGVTISSAPVPNPAEQGAAIRRMLDLGVKLLLVSPIDAQHATLTAAFSECSAAGVPVVFIGAAAPDGGSVYSVRSAERAGAATLAALLSKVGAAGKVAVWGIHGNGGYDAEAIRAALGSAPQLELIAGPVQASCDASAAPEEHCATWIRRVTSEYPDLQTIVALTHECAMVLSRTLDELRLDHRPRLAAFGTNPQSLLAIRQGRLSAVVLPDLGAMAERALTVCEEAARGGAPDAESLIDMIAATCEDYGQQGWAALDEMSALTREVTVRLAEQHATNDFLEAVLDRIPLLLFVKDAEDLRLVRINKTREEWFGVRRAEQLGKTARDMYPLELAMRFEASDRAVLNGVPDDETIVPEEHLTQSPRGSRYVQTKKMPMFDAEGKPKYLVGVSFDITARKQAELALAERNKELEEAHDALQQQQKKLIISEKMASIGRLTAGIAHEMNTPLAAVRTALNEVSALVEEYGNAIGDPEINDDDHLEIVKELRNALSLANKSAERASGFVRGIKSQTRDLAAHQRTNFNAVTVVQEALLLLSHALRDAKCTSRFERSADVVMLHGSPGRLAQVITNLTTNAIDALASKGGGEIVVELKPAGDFVELRVSDNGTGIPQEILTKIFDPMFTTKPFGSGTGLGLSILHDIVHSDFGGSIEVKSVVGEGTTFIMNLSAPKDGGT